MSSIPLPALDIKPPAQPESPIDTYSKIIGIKQMLQNQQAQAQMLPAEVQQEQQKAQMGQIQIQDAQAGMKAMQQWDGKDMSQLPDLIKKNGGSFDAVMKSQKSFLDYQDSLNKANKSQLDIQAAKNDYLLGKIQAATDDSVPDDQLPQTVLQAAQESVKDGYLDPPHAQQLQQMVQSTPDPKALRAQLSIYEKSLMGQKEQIAQANQTKTANAAQLRAQNTSPSAEGIALRASQGDPVAIAAQKNAAAQAATVAGADAAARAPIAINQAVAEARAKAPIDIATEVAKQKAIEALNPAPLANVKPSLVAPAAAAAQKAGEAFTQAQQAADDMQSMIALAKQGNKVSYSYIPVQGVLQINAAGQTKRVNLPEIEMYGGAGSDYDKLKAFLGKNISGASIPSNILDNMGGVSQTYVTNAKKKYDSDLALVDRNYGSSFSNGKTAAQAGGQPAGATHQVLNRTDGKMHWTDANNSKDMGVVQ